MLACRRLPALSLAALLIFASAHQVLAQGGDSTSLLGATRVSLDGSATLQPRPAHGVSVGGEYMRFVSEHWQLGLAPSIGASTSMVSTNGRSSLAGMANYLVGTGNLRWYAGGYASADNNAEQSGFAVFGVQAGALYLLSPTAALRGELTWRKPTGSASVASTQLIVFLDPYLPGTGSGYVTLPPEGAADVSGYVYAYASSAVSYEQGADIRLAPFLGRWTQVGLQLTSINTNFSGAKSGANEVVGFTRLYAPLSARAEPFVEAFGVTSTIRSLGTGFGVSGYGGSGGIRHYVNNGTAIDVGVAWRRFKANIVAGQSTRQPDEVTLQARMVTQLRFTPGSR